MEITIKLDTKNETSIREVIDFCTKLIPEPQISKDDLHKKLMDLALAKGSDVVKQLLNKYGVEKYADLPETKYNDMLHDVEEIA